MLTRSKPPITKAPVSNARQNYNARVKYGFYFGEATQPAITDIPEPEDSEPEILDEADCDTASITLADKSETTGAVTDIKYGNRKQVVKTTKAKICIITRNVPERIVDYKLHKVPLVYGDNAIYARCRGGSLLTCKVLTDLQETTLQILQGFQNHVSI